MYIQLINFLQVLFGPNSDHQKVWLGPRSSAEYAKALVDGLRPNLHLSKHGGDSQPFFYLYNVFANRDMIRVMNYVWVNIGLWKQL